MADIDTLKKNRKIIYLFVLVMGTESMALEMVLSRLLAPYFGTSLFIWGAVIAMVLTALSVGYYVGGKQADKNPTPTLLFTIGLIASSVGSVAVVIFDGLFYFVQGDAALIQSFFTVAGLFVISLILFAIPIFVFGMIVPIAIRVAIDSVEETGAISGSIFAYSTIGSIIGVLIPSFVTIPYIGSRETAYGFLFMGMLAALLHFKKKPIMVGLLLIPVIGFVISNQLYKQKNAQDIVVKESPYQLVRVSEVERGYHLKTNTGLGIQSVYYPGETTTEDYWDSFSAVSYVQNTESTDRNVLVLGMAGGSVARQLESISGEDFNYSFTGVEIDPDIAEIGNTLFEYEDEIVVDDARSFLLKTQDSYDMIIVDAYGKEAFIPAHLATKEFFTLAKSKLNPGGVVVVNINAPSRESKFYKSFTNTFANSYNHTYSIKVNELWNFLLIGSEEEIDFAKLDTVENELIDGLRYFFFKVDTLSPTKTAVLTDNKSNIDQLTARMYFEGIQ